MVSANERISRTASGIAASCPSSSAASTPARGASESTYDVWVGHNAHAIMLWLNYTGTAAGCGNVKPISYHWTSAGCDIPV